MIKTSNNVVDYALQVESPVNETTLFRCTNPNYITLKGYNVEVNELGVGDIIAYDNNNKLHFIAVDTWHYASNDANIHSLGVVGSVSGRDAVVVNKANTSKKWSQIYRWVVTGFSSATTSVVTLNGTNIGTLTDLDGTADTLITKFNELVNTYTTQESWDKVWHMYKEDDNVYLVYDSYTSHPSNTTSLTNMTVTVSNGPEVPATSTNYRKNGVSVYWGGFCLPRFIEYYGASGKTPTANVDVNATDPVTRAAFNTSQYCEALRAAYGTYENYMDMNMVQWPNTKGVMNPRVYADGKGYTYSLANKTYPDPDGIATVHYPFANYAATIGYAGVKGFEQGDWYVLSPLEMAPIWGQLTYGLSGVTKANSDPVNRSLNAIGGTAISCASHSWSSLRYNTNNAWCYTNSGALYSSAFYSSFTLVPSSLLHY